jgi:hypothetical protein
MRLNKKDRGCGSFLFNNAMVIKALGNWKSMQMADRYANIAAEGKRQYLDNSGWAGKQQPPAPPALV